MKKNYYAIIPANVRYDTDLSPSTKLLYGEITSLCNEKGFCWASNSYFSELYNLSDRTIQNQLKQLKEKKYIIIEIENNTTRKIYIVDSLYTIDNQNSVGGYEKNFVGGTKKISQGYEKNFVHNNTSNNKDNINNKEIFDYDWLSEK